MNLSDYCEILLFTNRLEDKFIDPSCIDDYSINLKARDVCIPFLPGRPKKLIASSERSRFPKLSSFTSFDSRAKALHFFANHELVAIEMMAATLLKCANTVEISEFKKISRGILSAIKDEQKHLKLYIDRMNEFGVDFGDFPVNDFFWKQMDSIATFSQYFSLMALTFEAANLDFCRFYGSLFANLGDFKTAQIMDEVYRDELTHVSLGAFWLNSWKKSNSLWNYYIDHLPHGITPARSKGIMYSHQNRKGTNLGDEFLTRLDNFNDTFKITTRKKSLR